MPLYEYKCRSCGKTFEVIEKFSAEPLKTHAGCGGAVERLISAPAFHLKGTGWYATDYAKPNGVKPENGKAGDSASEPASKTDAASPSESKADTKAENKSEKKPGVSDSKASSGSPPPATKPASSKPLSG